MGRKQTFGQVFEELCRTSGEKESPLPFTEVLSPAHLTSTRVFVRRSSSAAQSERVEVGKGLRVASCCKSFGTFVVVHIPDEKSTGPTLAMEPTTPLQS